MTDTNTPTIDDAPVTVAVLRELLRQYPAWRQTSHTTEEGREVWMIEFADDQHEFTDGLPGEFVSMVAEAGDDSEGSEVSDS